MAQEFKKIERAHILLIAIGFAVLAAGTLVYLTDRPPGTTYFVNRSPLPVHFNGSFSHFFGPLGFYFPSFAHALSFSLMTAGVLASGKKGGALVCLGWFAVDALFELGQKYGSAVAAYVPAWFQGIPFLENTAHYFRRGTFDPLDIAAAAAGAAAAWAVLLAFDWYAQNRNESLTRNNRIPVER